MEQQYIVCAAHKIVSENGREHIILGARHWDKWMLQQCGIIDDANQLPSKPKHDIQGFIDNKGNFLTRKEAWIVAEAAGQIRIQCVWNFNGDGTGVLYSENLY